MKKLTAEKCREFIDIFKSLEKEGHLSLASGYHLQAYEKALPALDEEHPTTDTYRQIENDGWIEWRGGKCPVAYLNTVDVRYRNGQLRTDNAGDFRWHHENDFADIIAYRVIENDGREG